MTQQMHILQGRIGGEFTAATADVPAPGEGQVRVRVRAAGFNNVDRMLIAATYDNLPDGPSGSEPYTAGIEFAGEVDALGEGVESVPLGARVTGIAPGAFAEYVLISAEQLILLPDSVAFTDAAALRVALTIAYDALVRRSKLAPGGSVLITGGTSGVGTIMIQLAKMLGASTVIATTRSAKKKAALQALGADLVIATDEEQLAALVLEATGGKGVDIVIDNLGGEVLRSAIGATRVEGTILLVGAAAGAEPALPVGEIAIRLLTIVGTAFDSRPLAERLEVGQTLTELFALVVDGRVRPAIDSVYRFPDEIPQAVDRVLSMDSVGKILFEMP